MFMKLIGWVQRQVMMPLIGQIDKWEDRVVAMPEAHRSVADSPVRFEVMKEKMKRENGLDPSVVTLMPPTIVGVLHSMSSSLP